MSLMQAKKALSDFYVEMPEDNVMHVSLDKDSLPFLIAVEENNKILLSFTADLDDTFLAVDVTLKICYVGETLLAEAFFIDEKGKLYFGEEAHVACGNDFNDLQNITPINKHIH